MHATAVSTAGFYMLKKRRKLLKTQGGEVHQTIAHARVVEAYIKIMAALAFLQFKFLFDVIFPATIGLNDCFSDDFPAGRAQFEMYFPTGSPTCDPGRYFCNPIEVNIFEGNKIAVSNLADCGLG